MGPLLEVSAKQRHAALPLGSSFYVPDINARAKPRELFARGRGFRELRVSTTSLGVGMATTMARTRAGVTGPRWAGCEYEEASRLASGQRATGWESARQASGIGTRVAHRGLTSTPVPSIQLEGVFRSADSGAAAVRATRYRSLLRVKIA